MTVTAEEIEVAQAEVREALVLAEKQNRVRQLQARADAQRMTFDRQEREIAAAGEAIAASSDRFGLIASDLDTSEVKAVKALQSVERAVERALSALSDHGEAVESIADQLVDDGLLSHLHGTVMPAGGSRGGVTIGERSWLTVDDPSALVAASALKAGLTHGARHGLLIRLLRSGVTGSRPGLRGDGLRIVVTPESDG